MMVELSRRLNMKTYAKLFSEDERALSLAGKHSEIIFMLFSVAFLV